MPALDPNDQLLARQLLARWRADIVAFCREVLGFEPWDHPTLPSQAGVLRASQTHTRITVRSGHKVGKALADDTPVLTPTGWTTHGALKPGDQVFAADGTVTNVVNVMRWEGRPLMRVHFETGAYIDADPEHEWAVRSRELRRPRNADVDAMIFPTSMLAISPTVPNGRHPDGLPRHIANWTIDLAGALQLPERDLPLDPYLLGLWLGDGTSADGGFTGIDGLHEAFERAGFDVTDKGDGVHWYVKGLVPTLRAIGVLGQKHVPEAYLMASAEQRLALLQGLMDTDGTIDARGRCDFTNTNEALARAVLQLARSLGIKARISDREARLNGRPCGTAWRVEWASPVPAFRLERKLARVRTVLKQKKNAHRRIAITGIERLPGAHSVQCIEVDHPTHLYLAGEELVPTHNSKAAAAIALAEYVLHPGSRTILTAPTGRQVKQVLWREIRTMHRRARFGLGGVCAIDPATGLTNAETDTQVLGFTTDDPDKFSGISGARVTYIVDEASGVADGIYEAIEGNRAGGARLILLGNPTQPRGIFFDSHNRDSHLYKTFHISSAATAEARAAGEIPDTPGLATKEWVDEYALRAGVASTEYQVRVEGNFPRVGSNSVFVAADVDLAIARWTPEPPDEYRKYPLECGLDVARFGDDKSTLVMRRGKYVYEPKEWSGLTGPQLANRVVVEIARVLYPGEGELAGSIKPLVRVDVAGVGASAYDSLNDMAPVVNINVVPVEFAGKAYESDRYVNRRAELWFNAAQAVRGMALPTSGKVRDDLLAPGYKFARDNRMQVEAKADIKKRLGRSPDIGDAFCLACDEHSALSRSRANVPVSVPIRRATETS